MAEADNDSAKFQIFRAKEAPGLMEAGCMTVEPFTPPQREGMNKALEAGYIGGDEIKVLTDLPGFGLTHVWFKEGYQLPLHSHDADCMYFIISGSLRLGTEELGPRDCFFVPADVPISVRADFRLRASVFFTEAITPIERTHRSAVEAEQQIAQASDTLAQSSVELADSQHELQNGITLREAAEAALQSSRDTFETLLKESRLLEVHLREVTRESLAGQEEERWRVSRQLHDDISQAILGIHVRLLVLKGEVETNHEGLSKEILITQGLLEESVESINRLIREFSIPNER